MTLLFATPGHSAFKDNGWGARPLGMGGAYCSVANDAQAILFNPAGIAQLEKTEISFTHSRLYLGLDAGGTQLYNNYAAVAQPLRQWGTLGLVWANQTASSLYKEDTYVLNYAQSLNTYWRELPFELLVGVNLKYLQNNFVLDSRTRTDPLFREGHAGQAPTFDLGLLINYERNSVGFAAKMINSPDIGLVSKDKVPREFTLGFSRYYYNLWAFNELYPSMDIVYRDEVDPDMNIRIGVEALLWNKTAALRLGAEHSRAVSLGAGYNFAKILRGIELQTDYAFVLPMTVDGTNGTHRLSMTLRFGWNESKSASTDLPLPVQETVASSTGTADDQVKQFIPMIETPAQRIYIRKEMAAKEMWNEYVRLVQSGADMNARKKFLKKFMKKMRYSGVDLRKVVNEYEAVITEIEQEAGLEKINKILNSKE